MIDETTEIILEKLWIEIREYEEKTGIPFGTIYEIIQEIEEEIQYLTTGYENEIRNLEEENNELAETNENMANELGKITNLATKKQLEDGLKYAQAQAQMKKDAQLIRSLHEQIAELENKVEDYSTVPYEHLGEI